MIDTLGYLGLSQESPGLLLELGAMLRVFAEAFRGVGQGGV